MAKCKCGKENTTVIIHDDSEWICEECITIRNIEDRISTQVENKITTPDQILEAMSKTFKKRHEIYGDNYLMIGHVMEALFPNHMHIETPNEWNRFHLFFMIVQKITRLACTEINHKDSVHDIGVYAAMLESMFEENEITDTDRINAIVDGYCIGCDIDSSGGIITYHCIYNGQVAKAKTIREAIDKATKGQFEGMDK